MTLLIPVIAWVVIYSLDNYLTIWSTRELTKPPLSAMFSHEGGLELNPGFISEVSRLVLFGPRFRLYLVVSLAYIVLVWYLAVVLIHLQNFFLFAFGSLFLLEATVIVRHLRNVAVVRAARAGMLAEGALHTPRSLALRLASADFLSFAGLYLILGLASHSWLILGGAFSCAIFALRSRRWARSTPKPPRVDTQGPAPSEPEKKI